MVGITAVKLALAAERTIRRSRDRSPGRGDVLRVIGRELLGAAAAITATAFEGHLAASRDLSVAGRAATAR